jgi:hypothetical protein
LAVPSVPIVLVSASSTPTTNCAPEDDELPLDVVLLPHP